ncbi:MAG: gamma-glutamylcyclotransferase [Gemmataceae bacterium]|nr:gamma-glutamylcyclotransferase [Gemmataceae bacterium]
MANAILFLYGSLKHGGENHRLVADQVYLGPAVTEPGYRVVSLGRYPGLVEDAANGLAVAGELWQVSRCCLLELDDFEGGEGEWVRRPVAVAGREGVEAYFYDGPVPEGAPSGAGWPLK